MEKLSVGISSKVTFVPVSLSPDWISFVVVILWKRKLVKYKFTLQLLVYSAAATQHQLIFDRIKSTATNLLTHDTWLFVSCQWLNCCSVCNERKKAMHIYLVIQVTSSFIIHPIYELLRHSIVSGILYTQLQFSPLFHQIIGSSWSL